MDALRRERIINMDALQLGIYKGICKQGNEPKFGAIQFSLQKPHYYVDTKSNKFKDLPREDFIKLRKLKNFQGRFLPDWWRDKFPQLNSDDLVSREGAMFINIASTIGPNQYDWENKVVMSLSVNDMAKLLMVLEGSLQEMKLMHDPGAKTERAGQVKKYLNLSSPKGIKIGATFSISETAGDKKKSHFVPLSGDEVKLLSTLIRGAIPACLAWV